MVAVFFITNPYSFATSSLSLKILYPMNAIVIDIRGERILKKQ